MINKIYKIINNRFSRFFKFIFFLRYLFTIFFVAIALFLTIPQFFDYKKKEEIIKNFLELNGLEIQKIDNIKFHTFPLPHLKINNLSINFFSEKTNLKAKELIIFPKILSIYNYNNFAARKIKIENSYLETDLFNLKFICQNILKINSNILIKNLDAKIMDKAENKIFELEKVNFANYGYKKNKMNGIIFDKNFVINFKEDLRSINFELINTGFLVSLDNLQNTTKNKVSGILRSKILGANLKLNFIYDKDKIYLNDIFFREKKLSFNSEGFLKLNPFFKINLSSNIKDIDTNLFKNLDIDKLLSFKDFLKKLNSEQTINFKPKRFNKSLISNLNIFVNLAYGRLETSKKISILETNLSCSSNINLLDDFPVFYFECSMYSPNKKELFKKIGINTKIKNDTFKLDVIGNLNPLSKKVNFKTIKVNENYKATQEDLKYFKKTFENILFDDNFIEIFNISKIKKFVSEIL